MLACLKIKALSTETKQNKTNQKKKKKKTAKSGSGSSHTEDSSVNHWLHWLQCHNLALQVSEPSFLGLDQSQGIKQVIQRCVSP